MKRVPPEFLGFLHDRLRDEGPGDRVLAETGVWRLTARANNVPLWYHRRTAPAPGQDQRVQAVELSLRGPTWRATWYWENCGQDCERCTFSAAAVVLSQVTGLFIRDLELDESPAGWKVGVPVTSTVVWFNVPRGKPA